MMEKFLKIKKNKFSMEIKIVETKYNLKLETLNY